MIVHPLILNLRAKSRRLKGDNVELREVLKRHHQWNLKYKKKLYQYSALCEDTCAALANEQEGK